MPRLTPEPRDKIIKALTKAYGCYIIREGRRHTIHGRDDFPEVIAVLRHSEISPGVIRNICRILGVKTADFLEVLRNCSLRVPDLPRVPVYCGQNRGQEGQDAR